MKRIFTAALAPAIVVLGLAAPAWSKLPPPTDEQKAKAAEASAKAADAAKAEAELLAKWQDITARKYAAKLKAEGKPFNPQIAPTLADAKPAAGAPAQAKPAAAPAGAKPAGAAK